MKNPFRKRKYKHHEKQRLLHQIRGYNRIHLEYQNRLRYGSVATDEQPEKFNTIKQIK